MDLIARKSNGDELELPAVEPEAPKIVDLMVALEASVEAAQLRHHAPAPDGGGGPAARRPQRIPPRRAVAQVDVASPLDRPKREATAVSQLLGVLPLASSSCSVIPPQRADVYALASILIGGEVAGAMRTLSGVGGTRGAVGRRGTSADARPILAGPTAGVFDDALRRSAIHRVFHRSRRRTTRPPSYSCQTSHELEGNRQNRCRSSQRRNGMVARWWHDADRRRPVRATCSLHAALLMERVTGIEPAPPAWKAGALAVELHPRGGALRVAAEASAASPPIPFAARDLAAGGARARASSGRSCRSRRRAGVGDGRRASPSSALVAGSSTAPTSATPLDALGGAARRSCWWPCRLAVVLDEVGFFAARRRARRRGPAPAPRAVGARRRGRPCCSTSTPPSCC